MNDNTTESERLYSEADLREAFWEGMSNWDATDDGIFERYLDKKKAKANDSSNATMSKFRLKRGLGGSRGIEDDNIWDKYKELLITINDIAMKAFEVNMGEVLTEENRDRVKIGFVAGPNLTQVLYLDSDEIGRVVVESNLTDSNSENKITVKYEPSA